MRVRIRGLFTISLLGLIFASCLFIILSRTYESNNKTRKIALIERAVRSPVNKEACRLPDLPIDSPEIMHYYKKVKKIQCGKGEEDWIKCHGNICQPKESISSKYQSIKCTFNELLRKSDDRVRYGKANKKAAEHKLTESDFVKAVCQDNKGHLSFGIAVGVRAGVSPPKGRKEPGKKYFNVLMLGFDSLSRNHYIRKLPKTYNYLVKQLNAIVLKGYNIVGDGTPQALIPLLTGHTELELPETRKRITNSKYVDIYPFIWKDYRNAGYVTSFNEDYPRLGTFNYRLNGFEKPPVDHYMRPFYVEADTILSNSDPNCIGYTPDHLIMLNYTYEVMKYYAEDPRFIFSFHGGLSHDDINPIGAADEDVVNLLQQMHTEGLLNQTILIMMADHGSRFSALRATMQGKQEERLPFFSFVLPESFAQEFPKEYRNLIKNSARLVTPFDIHATLKDILVLQNLYVPDETQVTPTPVSNLAKNRAISLFEKIPEDRSCYDAYIEPHWCACLNWVKMDLNDKNNFGVLMKAAAAIVDTINEATKDWRDVCTELKLLRVNWALQLQPKTELLQFQGSSDADGYEPVLAEKMRMNEVFYQLQIVLEPGDSLFEASVVYDKRDLKMHLKLTEISRINKYASQVLCIFDKNPDLRKFCYCRTTKS